MARLEWFNSACLFVLLFAAALDTRLLLRQSPRRLLRVWRALLLFVAIVLSVLTGGLAVLFLIAPADVAASQGLEMIGLGLNQLCLAFVFLLGALALDRDPLGRPLPLLDRLHARRRFSPGRRRDRLPFFRTLAVSRFFVYLSLMLVHSYVWLFFAFNVIDVRFGRVIEEIVNPPEPVPARAAILVRMISIMLAPFYEEIIYRGYIQARVTRLFVRFSGASHWGRVLAPGGGIVATSLLWAVMHSGVLEPEWIKWGQILGIGLVLGIARLRLGLEGCVVLHLAFNVFGGFLVPSTFPDDL